MKRLFDCVKSKHNRKTEASTKPKSSYSEDDDEAVQSSSEMAISFIDQTSGNNGQRTPESNHLLVAAFDIGTSYSGFAFSFRAEPMKIQTNEVWNSGSLMSLKTPTCILLTPNGEFDSFGYEAENKYSDLVEDKKHDGWFLFKSFKMFLHKNQILNILKDLSRDATVQDVNGNSVSALKLFAMAIGYMRDQMLSQLDKRLPGISESDIKYVVTVPAIWSDKAKQFMREAGIKAGIDTGRLVLALEPEAASIWCQTIPEPEPKAASIWCQTIPTATVKCLSENGTKYMVVDLGGGTVDISVHEKMSDGSLKQLHKASGGPWGGGIVDKNYIDWLTDVLGETTLERFKREEISDYLELLREFETKKRTIKHGMANKVTLRLFTSLRDIHEDCEHRSIEETITQKRLANRVTCSGDKLRVDASVVKEWFDEPIQHIISHVNEILAEPGMESVHIILLVGGFGECELVQQQLRRQILGKKWVIPEDAGLVVLKGAVKFGHLPSSFAQRVAPYTYGMNTSCVFDPKIHPASKLLPVSADGKRYVDNVFGVFVRIGEEVRIGHEEKRVITPTLSHETRVRIFTSIERFPQFVDDPGCREIGSIVVCHPENEQLENKEFEVTFYFGGTEIHVTSRMLNSTQEFKTIIDWL